MRVLAFSGGKDSMACLHLMRDSLACAIYVDTGFTYPETLALVDYAAKLLPMHVVHADRQAQNEREGIPADVVPIDWTPLGQALGGPKPVKIQSYLGCCYENISAPIIAKARELGATEIVSGERRGENRKSASMDGQLVAGLTRLHPIYEWSGEEVIRYLESKMEVPQHYAIKHSSLDCYDCTGYHKDSTDRVAWMRETHPVLFSRYVVRRKAIDNAILEAL